VPGAVRTSISRGFGTRGRIDGVTVVLDLDGVVWLADRPIPGAPEAVARLRAGRHRVLFVSNNSFSPIADVEKKLEGFGIPAGGDVLTSAVAAAALLKAGDRVFLCAGPGAEEAITKAGGEVVTDGDADAVVVGFHRTFDYEELRRACTAVRRGARLIGTNDDVTYPTPEGPIPGGGAILAAVVAGSGVAATVAGKPYEPMAQLVQAELGGADLSTAVMVGDRPDTDGRFARAIGCRFALVFSGVTHRADLPVNPTPDLVADDLASLADQLLSNGPNDAV
jgi:HAD superfamily hydrolase (TIGR01450 family)